MDPGDQGGWSCCLPTADETTLSLSCPLDPAEPWLVGRALDILRQGHKISSDPEGERYAAGSRRGAPLILGEPLLWEGLKVVLEACQAPDQPLGELTVRLPPWSELSPRIEEGEVWLALDELCHEFRARLAVVSDGRTVGYPGAEAPRPWARSLQRAHLGVALPERWLDSLRRGSNPYWWLERSELVLVLE